MSAVLEMITPENLQATRQAADAGTLRVAKVSRDHYQLRDKKEVLVDGLKGHAQAFVVLSTMSKIEHDIITPPWLQKWSDKVDQKYDEWLKAKK